MPPPPVTCVVTSTCTSAAMRSRTQFTQVISVRTNSSSQNMQSRKTRSGPAGGATWARAAVETGPARQARSARQRRAGMRSLDPERGALVLSACQRAAVAVGLPVHELFMISTRTVMLAILLATYAAVFLAEIVGDKLLYTTGILATRYRPVPIMIGMAMAFATKMAVAVAVGQAISKLPRTVVAGVTALSFLGIAFTLWRKPMKSGAPKREAALSKGALVAFAAILFSEWGDIGQITAATMVAPVQVPVVVWIGAVAAMVTKGILAAFLGAGVRRWISARVSPRVIRVGGVSLLLVLGVLSVLETLQGRELF